MKAEAQRTKKEPVSEEPQIESQSISIQIPSDPLAAEVNQDGLFYLGFAAGVITTAPDSLQSVNIEMWPIEQIYKLRSDLISLSLIIDDLDKEIQNNLQIGFENILNELHQNEIEEPLRFQHLSSFSSSSGNSSLNYMPSSCSSYNYPSSPFLSSSSSSILYPSPSLSSSAAFSNSSALRKPKQEIRFDHVSYTRPCSPSPTMMQNRLASSSRPEQLLRSRPQSTHIRRSKSTTLSRTSMTPETLWENVDLFMKPINKFSAIQSYLVPTEFKNDSETILNEPVGPHYSTTICRSPSILSDPIKSKLIIPPPPSNLSGNAVTSSYLHSRLISAIVPLLPPTKSGNINRNSLDHETGEKGQDLGENISENESHNCTTDNEDNDNSISFADNDLQFDFDQSFNSSNYSNKFGNQNISIIKDLKTAEYNSFPTTECTGFTGYGWLSFDDRLEMELAYVGIEGSGNVVTTADCPITQDLKEALKERDEMAKEANKWKKVISDIVQENKSKLEQRSKKIKRWNEAMDHFRAQEKAKAQQGKKKAKPNSNSTESD